MKKKKKIVTPVSFIISISSKRKILQLSSSALVNHLHPKTYTFKPLPENRLFIKMTVGLVYKEATRNWNLWPKRKIGVKGEGIGNKINL